MWKVACGILGLGAGVCVQAGLWQLRRKKWKEELIAQRDTMLGLPPIVLSPPFPWHTDPATNWEFRRVKATGELHHSREMRIMRAQADQPGFKLYTPFQLPSGEVLIAGRGWVPKALANWFTRKELPGAVTLEGVLRRSEEQGKYIPANLPQIDEWNYVNLAEMYTAAGVPGRAEPYYLQCIDFQSRMVYGFNESEDQPVPDTTRNLMTWWATPETHLSYAVFWFSSSAICLLFLLRTFRHR